MNTINNFAVAEKSAQLSDFDRAWATGITLEELRQHLHKSIDSWQWKKK